MHAVAGGVRGQHRRQLPLGRDRRGDVARRWRVLRRRTRLQCARRHQLRLDRHSGRRHVPHASPAPAPAPAVATLARVTAHATCAATGATGAAVAAAVAAAPVAAAAVRVGAAECKLPGADAAPGNLESRDLRGDMLRRPAVRGVAGWRRGGDHDPGLPLRRAHLVLAVLRLRHAWRPPLRRAPAHAPGGDDAFHCEQRLARRRRRGRRGRRRGAQRRHGAGHAALWRAHRRRAARWRAAGLRAARRAPQVPTPPDPGGYAAEQAAPGERHAPCRALVRRRRRHSDRPSRRHRCRYRHRRQGHRCRRHRSRPRRAHPARCRSLEGPSKDLMDGGLRKVARQEVRL